MSSRALKIFGAVFALLVVGGGAAGYAVVKSKRTAYVRETMNNLTSAETTYGQGGFEEAARSSAGALRRQMAHPTWFDAQDVSRLQDVSTFLDSQFALWTKAQASVPAPGKTDETFARQQLENVLAEARKGEPRARPLTSRIEPLLQTALTRERERVEADTTVAIPDAQKAYVEGTWDALLERIEKIRASIAKLPDATRETAAKNLEGAMKPLESLAAPVVAMRAIRAGTEDGVVKADRLRDLIRALPDLKGRDVPLYRELRSAIAQVDPETRKPVAGLTLKKGAVDHLVGLFSKGLGLERTGNLQDNSVIELESPANHYALRVVGNPPQLLVEVDRVRLMIPLELVDDREALSMQAAAELSKALRAARPARLFADEAWGVVGNAPALCAMNIDGSRASVILGGRLYEGLASETDNKAQMAAFITSARALEQAIGESAAVPDEIKGPIAAFMKATYGRAPPGDHLDVKFCREAIQEGYLEAQLPKIDEKVAAALAEYRKLYGEATRLRTRFEAKAVDGATVTLFVNLENAVLWRVVDPAAKTTTFSTSPRDHMGSYLTVVSVFAGTHADFPKDAEPVEVRMTHGVIGTVSRWTAADGKLEFDPARWASAVTLGEGIPEQFGTGDWQVPPHALKVDARGQARELILPSGSIRVEAFSGPDRRAAQDAFLDKCAKALHTPGEYHLFYRYLVQYVLDSPVTTATTLIGSGKHCGDAHQDAYQTLDRRLNGRFLSDCDDLAELYWTILRRQDRPAFVLGVPGHATCGVAEKSDAGWTFFCVDTGPARQLKGADLDGIIEKLLRSYDRDRSMSFDPRQMRFLFRFAGEQTRSDYFLDSRILRDPPYADLMIRVQEYWHFGFYALGIETMSKVLETDRMPANCQEIAGLYTRVGLWDEALKWTEAGIKGLDAKDVFTGLSDTMRVIQCHREMKRRDEAVKVLKKAANVIDGVVKADPSVEDRYRFLKFQVATQYAELELPWDGWAFIEDEVVGLVKAGVGAESLMTMVTEIYSKMRDAQRAGAALTEDQVKQMEKVGKMLQEHHATSMFERDDSNLDLMRKYAQLYAYYAAVEGGRKAAAELAKPGYPEEKAKPGSRDAADDWAWMRLSPYAYAVASGKALDKDDKTAGGPKEAIAVIRAMEAALPEMRRRGSLGTAEFSVLDLKLLRACLEMDEKDIRSVFAEMKRQGWGELYENLSRTLGGAAPFMKLADFEKVVRIYCEYGVPRRHYYGVVYSASAAEARDAALAASKICIEKFPNDADMRREHELLLKLSK